MCTICAINNVEVMFRSRCAFFTGSGAQFGAVAGATPGVGAPKHRCGTGVVVRVLALV